MELAYFYDQEGNAEMERRLDEDFFKRLGPVIRESRTIGFDKDGFFMYIKARDDLAEEAKKNLEGAPIKLLEGQEAEKVLNAFREELENAEAGMGALFG